MSDRARYVELHAASSFSFLEGASNPERLIDQAAALGLPSIAITDRNGVYGAARFHSRAKALNHSAGGDKIAAHIGAEISTVAFGQRSRPAAHLPHRIPEEPVRLTLLCATRTGYQNLCQLITRYKLRALDKQEGTATFEDLAQHAEGLVCLTGGDEGPLAAMLSSGGERAASQLLDQLIALYGQQSVYVELQRHHERDQEWRNQAAIRLAQKHRLPVLATNGVRYATVAERRLLDVFTGIRHHVSLEQAGRLLARNSERHLRSAAEMQQLFYDVPRAVEQTVDLAAQLSFRLDDLGYEFPGYPVPDGETMASFLAKRVREGVLARYGGDHNQATREKAHKQAASELALIERLGFEGYFLIVWDIVNFCKKNGILIQGRGSAANSVVCYVLEITAVNPLVEGKELLFERFLSESRGEWPDIDLDLPSGDKREQAIQYVYQRYGELGAAMTANVITYRGRSAAREVGKVLGFDEETLNRLSSLVGHWEWKAKTDTMPNQFVQAGFDLNHPRIARYLELCLALQDLPRHLGQHSGGMVICQGLLNKIVPLERASMPGRTVVQWDKEDCADLGIIKVDLLGLGMMAVMKDCVELVSEHHGKEYNLGALPQDVPELYDALCRADTVGMFQVESRAQMASLPRNMPRCFYDIVVQVAIIRPGPIVGKMMHPYMRRRQKKEKVTYPHPSLEPVLERTLGVPLFQEQLLRMAMTVASFSGAEAEELRRAVGMRRSMERMEELVVKLRAGMTANRITLEVQDNIVQSVSSFALYGFPESHAASFALIAYASAYFKVRYLAAFTCAMLNNQPMGFYMPAVIVKDAQRHGLRVRPIDVQSSHRLCTLEREPDGTLSLRMGLIYAKGLRAQAAEAIVEERERGNAFASVDEFELRLRREGRPGLKRAEMVQLARIGALNSIGHVAHRRDALWQVEQAGRPAGPLLSRQASGLAGMGEEPDDSPLAKMTTEERLVADFGGTGLTTGPHPMAYKRSELRQASILSSAELTRTANGTYVRTAGCVIARQRPGTASGFIFLSLEDETGIANVIIHPELYEQQRMLVMGGKFLLIQGRLQNDDSVVHVRAEHVELLSMAKMEMRSHDFH